MSALGNPSSPGGPPPCLPAELHAQPLPSQASTCGSLCPFLSYRQQSLGSEPTSVLTNDICGEPVSE